MSISDNPVTREMWGTPALTVLQPYDVGRDAYTARTKKQVLAQIRARVVVLPNECWVWTGSRRGASARAYGVIGWQGRSRSVHRLHWELALGPIDSTLQIDHKCHQTLCANLRHLELVTCRENMHRRLPVKYETVVVTHCCHGHEFTPENTIVTAHQRICRECDIYRASKYARDNGTTPLRIRGHRMERSSGLEWHCTCGQWLATGHRGLGLAAHRDHRAAVWAELLANRSEAA